VDSWFGNSFVFWRLTTPRRRCYADGSRSRKGVATTLPRSSFPGTLRIRRYLGSNHGAFRAKSNLFSAAWKKAVQGLDIMAEIKPNILLDLIFLSIFSKFWVREAALWTW
jgi:hypothetical protein